uniref:dienelactone hydrolase family protein n=1 Tax=uncultured Draconibacterium sp. TaxID=1573823 RepID=UPI003217D818
MAKLLNRRRFILDSSLVGFGFSVLAAHRTIALPIQTKLENLLVDNNGDRIKTRAQWEEKRKTIKRRWLDYLGVLKPNPEKPILKVLKEDYPEGVVRQYVGYEGEPGITVNGYLLKPQKIRQTLPGVVVFHSTGDKEMHRIAGLGEGEMDDFGLKLAQQGYVVFCPECFLWHNKNGRTFEEQTLLFQKRHPRSKGMAKMLFDAQRAVDVLETLDEVDTDRIASLGHSLGGKEALYLGAFDERVKVVVCNEAGIGIDLSNWEENWYLGNEIVDFGYQHHEVLVLNAPKPFLLIGGDSADGEKSRPYIEAVKPVYKLYGKERNIVLKNHGAGHYSNPVAEEWMYEWIKKHLEK